MDKILAISDILHVITVVDRAYVASEQLALGW